MDAADARNCFWIFHRHPLLDMPYFHNRFDLSRVVSLAILRHITGFKGTVKRGRYWTLDHCDPCTQRHDELCIDLASGEWSFGSYLETADGIVRKTGHGIPTMLAELSCLDVGAVRQDLENLLMGSLLILPDYLETLK